MCRIAGDKHRQTTLLKMLQGQLPDMGSRNGARDPQSMQQQAVLLHGQGAHPSHRLQRGLGGLGLLGRGLRIGVLLHKSYRRGGDLCRGALLSHPALQITMTQRLCVPVLYAVSKVPCNCGRYG